MLDNGIELSVVAGKGMYSTGKNGIRSAVDKVKDVSTFEVAVIDPDGKFIGEVIGWQSRADIDTIIQLHS
jgi:hypothetical protein